MLFPAVLLEAVPEAKTTVEVFGMAPDAPSLRVPPLIVVAPA
jgi:hypothetical protein